jgi:hypothetical protein
MDSSVLALVGKPQPRKNRVSFESGLRLQIVSLIRERDALHEEVQQLRAAVQIYSEVVNRLQVEKPQLVSRRLPK